MDPRLWDPDGPDDKPLSRGVFTATIGWAVTVVFCSAVAVAQSVFTARSALIACIRSSCGVFFILVAIAMPIELLSSISAFVGKMFFFVALYGLAAPLESKLVEGAADFILKAPDKTGGSDGR